MQEVNSLRGQRSQRRRERLGASFGPVSWALLPVCFVESKAETGGSAHLMGDRKQVRRQRVRGGTNGAKRAKKWKGAKNSRSARNRLAAQLWELT